MGKYLGLAIILIGWFGHAAADLPYQTPDTTAFKQPGLPHSFYRIVSAVGIGRSLTSAFNEYVEPQGYRTFKPSTPTWGWGVQYANLKYKLILGFEFKRIWFNRFKARQFSNPDLPGQSYALEAMSREYSANIGFIVFRKEKRENDNYANDMKIYPMLGLIYGENFKCQIIDNNSRNFNSFLSQDGVANTLILKGYLLNLSLNYEEASRKKGVGAFMGIRAGIRVACPGSSQRWMIKTGEHEYRAIEGGPDFKNVGNYIQFYFGLSLS
jgi:hypothetical protein